MHQLLIPLKEVTNILLMTYSVLSMNGTEPFQAQEHHRVVSGVLQKKLYAFLHSVSFIISGTEVLK